ncbi:MAG TPA: hypothetical protein V6D15_16040 [Oculatellaceae cyanobacterium]|jgi:hypothetical protein
MAIKLTHFCTKTGKPILVNGEVIAEEITCLAEYFCPSATYAVGRVYEGMTTSEDLRQHQGLSLEFSHHDRFFFMSEKLRDEMMDEPSLGAAYGSNFFTPLEYLEELSNIKVLVVDWQTGENGAIRDPVTEQVRDRLSRDLALQLVGEGDGRIDNRLHSALGNAANTQFQFRAGIKKQANCSANQFLKGTMAPLDLKVGLAQYFPDTEAPELIISTDQLKGRKNKDNSLGILDAVTKKPLQVGNALQPGEYVLTMAIGKTKDAHLHASSTGAQLLNAVGEAAFPDLQPRLEMRLRELRDMLGDPRKIALDYIRQSEARNKYKLKKQLEPLLDVTDAQALDEALTDLSTEIDDEKVVTLLKADLAGHVQILEMPRIMKILGEHYQEQLRDCALGRFLKFESAMALSCRVLAVDEVCIPHLPDRESVIVYRPPVSSSNVMAVLTNRHIKDDPLNPMRSASILLHPQSAMQLKIDKDGDEPIFAPASQYPNMAAEIIRRNQPENRYLETLTPPKAKYQGMTFEEIALAAMDNKVGLVANYTMKAIALESECRVIPDAEKERFLSKLSQSLIENSQFLSSVPEECNVLNDDRLKKLASLHSRFISEQYQNNPLTPAECNNNIAIAQSVFKDVVGILANQLEIEVQSGKSANRSNVAVLEFCEAVCQQPVYWLRDRKLEQVYLKKAIESNTHGIIDSLVQATNSVFKESSLIPRRISHFQNLFKGIESTEPQKETAKALRNEYNQLALELSQIHQEINLMENKPYLKLIATSTKGNQLKIALTQEQLRHPQLFNLNQLDNVMLIKDDNNGRWKVTAATIDLSTGKVQMKEDGKAPLRKQIGYLTDKSHRENYEILQAVAGIQKKNNYLDLKTLNIEIIPGYSKKHEEAVVRMLAKKAEELYTSIPEHQKQFIAAAMWEMSTQQYNDPKKTKEERIDIERKNFTGAAFAIFNKQIVSRLEQLQFTNLTVVGTQKNLNEWKSKQWNQEKVDIAVELLPNIETGKVQRWIIASGKRLGAIGDESAQLPVGTRATATIISGESSVLQLTSKKGNQLKVTHTSRYAYKDVEWQGQEVDITVLTQPQKDDATKLTGFVMINSKKLGIIEKESFEQLCSVLDAAGVQVDGAKLKMTASYALANYATVEVDPQTVKYPLEWTRDNLETEELEKVKFQIIRQLQPILAEKYQTPSLFVDFDDAIQIGLDSNFFKLFEDYEQNIQVFEPNYIVPDLNVQYLNSSYVPEASVILLEDIKNNFSNHIHKITEEIIDRFGCKCFLQRNQTGEIYEYYYCVDLAGMNDKRTEIIEQTLHFPYKNEEMQNGEKEIYLAIPLSELHELITTYYETVTQTVGQQDLVVTPQQQKVDMTTVDLDNIVTSSVTGFREKKEVSNLAIANTINTYTPSSVFIELANSFSIKKQDLGTWYLQQHRSDTEISILLEKLNEADKRALASSDPQLLLILNSHQKYPHYSPQFNDAIAPEVIAAAQQLIQRHKQLVSNSQSLSNLNNDLINNSNIHISGKPIPMVFPLKLHGEPNLLPVNTCIDAMRGYGRCHTTRTYEPYKVYGFKEGDIAIATTHNLQVAFRVGQQYRITPSMINDLQYRKQWADQEKHSEKELLNFQNKKEVWGLKMEPLGDYIDGKIVPFPELITQPPISQTQADLEQGVLIAEKLNELMRLRGTSTIEGGQYIYKRELDVNHNTISFTVSPKGDNSASIVFVACHSQYGWEIQNSLPEGHAQAITDSLAKTINKVSAELATKSSSISNNSAPLFQRPLWEAKMLEAATRSLGKSSDPHIAVGCFGEGNKYKVIGDRQDDTIQIIDRVGNRGVIWMGARGQSPAINKVTSTEQDKFLNINCSSNKSHTQQVNHDLGGIGD